MRIERRKTTPGRLDFQGKVLEVWRRGVCMDMVDPMDRVGAKARGGDAEGVFGGGGIG